MAYSMHLIVNGGGHTKQVLCKKENFTYCKYILQNLAVFNLLSYTELLSNYT